MTLPGQLHHIGWAVADAGHAVQLFRGLGYESEPTLPDRLDPDFGVELRFLRRAGDPVLIELVIPARSDAVVAALLARNGPGPYHLAYRVDDLAATAATLRETGFRPITPRRPAPALAGRDIQFFRHAQLGLVELIQWPQPA